MSAAQESFQLFLPVDPTRRVEATLFAASFDDKTRVPDGFGVCKRFAKVFSKLGKVAGIVGVGEARAESARGDIGSKKGLFATNER
jgi:hypothetical protein